MKRQQSAHRTKRFALFLGIIISLVILAAFLIKVVIMISHSTFDGQHQFILQVQHPHATELLVFSPDSNTINDILLSGLLSKHTLLQKFAIPVDGEVSTENTESPKDVTRSLLFQFGTFHPSITLFDAMRLFFFAQGVIPQNIHSDSLVLSSDRIALQQKINKDFMDQTLYKESVSIAIVNAAGISGLGNNVALLLTHIGANVISVTSSQQVTTHSVIQYTGEPTYTLQRLKQVLDLPLQHVETAGVTDITVLIGTNDAERFAP